MSAPVTAACTAKDRKKIEELKNIEVPPIQKSKIK